MTTEATQPGAEALSVEDRIANFLAAEEPVEAPQQAEPVEPAAEAEPEEETPVAEAEPVEAKEQTEEEVEEIEWDASDVARVLGVEADSVIITDTGDLKFKTKVDGNVSDTTLTELIRGHQIESHVRNQSQALAEERKAFADERQKLTAELQSRIEQAGALIGAGEQQLLAEFNSIDWNTLERTDPGQYAAQRQKYAERYQLVQQAKQHNQQQQQTLQQDNQTRLNADYQAHLASEREVLKGSHPELLEEAGRNELIEHLKSRGLGNPDTPWKRDFVTALISNAVGLEILKESMLYRQSKGNVDVKKLKKLPKIVKPGATKSKAQKAQAEKTTDIQNFRKRVRNKRGSDSVGDLAEMINKHIL